jgi:hypothetical protein
VVEDVLTSRVFSKVLYIEPENTTNVKIGDIKALENNLHLLGIIQLIFTLTLQGSIEPIL